VDRIWEPALSSPFQSGDRLLSVNGEGVRTLGELARALKTVLADQSAEVKVLRAGGEAAFSWTPFPRARKLVEAGRVVDIHQQFGITFEGYPLETLAGNRAGVTGEAGPLEIELPRGSYLFLFQKPGYADTRLPVLIPRDSGACAVKLLRNEEVPPGFVHVPAGPFHAGGDEAAYESRERNPRQHVDGFLLARLEVTWREYLEFLNDPELLKRLDPEGQLDRADLSPEWTGEELRPLSPRDPRILLVPSLRDRPILRRTEGGEWALPSNLQPDFPVLGVPMAAAVEYAHWLTGKHGGRWRFRLPRQREWEKAARGVDGRTHVWGNYLILNFCHSLLGVHPGSSRGNGLPADGGSHPFDESVYGVRDLAGSLGEPTSEKAVSSARLYVYCGGSCQASDRRDFHAASRNRGLPERSYRYIGIRLAADLPR
jgi:formylglycine-generating enzyme required for sulfatase activity